MLIAFVSLSMLIVILMASAGVLFGLRTSQSLVIDELVADVVLNKQAINNWLDERIYNLSVIVNSPYDFTQLQRLLIENNNEEGADLEAYQELLDRFAVEIAPQGRFMELFVINQKGKVVLSTNNENLGKNYRHQSSFQQGKEAPSISNVYFNPLHGGHQAIVTMPIIDEHGTFIGMLMGRLDILTMTEFVLTRADTTETGEAYLVSDDRSFITDLRFEPESKLANSAGIDRALTDGEHRNGQGIYENYNGVRVVGAYRWLPDLRVVFLSERAESEALQNVNRFAMFNGGLGIIAIIVSIGIALIITNYITRPITDLTAVATAIAEGNLDIQAEVKTKNEIGVLAHTFNHMATQLRDLVDSLELKVMLRTHRLQMVAMLSENLNAILNFDQLLIELIEVVNMIGAEFGGYFVGVWLLTNDKKSVELRVTTEQTGDKILKSGFRVPFDTVRNSIFADVCRTGKHYLSNDVSQDANYFGLEELPHTKSEFIVPLRIGHEIIGVLDIQSDYVNTFDSDDDVVLQMLANQIAIAIRNARMYEVEKDLHKIEAEKANQLAQLNASKDKFFSIISHDLKGPFQPLLGMTELLPIMVDMESHPDEISEMAMSINTSAKNVYNLLENLLSWSRMQRGHVPFEPAKLDLRNRSQGVVELLTASAESKGILLQSKVSSDIYVYADSNMLDTVIRNLTSNALKFTANGGSIIIQSSVRIMDSKYTNDKNKSPIFKDFVEVWVSDTGVGMPPDVVNKLFMIDVHHSTIGTNKEQGTGLGLIICQEMVQKNGGEIWAESEIGRGTTMKFTIPLDSATTEHVKDNITDPELLIRQAVPVEKEHLVAPPPDELEILHHLAMMGDMQEIKVEAKRIRKLDEQYIPFMDKIIKFARNFADDEILELLKNTIIMVT